ncbi:MAG: glycosyltransferase [Deltaproteobacteria bacterium]|nr:glycosyltransferase [Deltaproteobacteria bacterium]
MSRPLRILQAVPYFDPAYRYGGPVKSVFQLCVHLARRGHEVVVYATNANGDERLPVRAGEPVPRDGFTVTYFANYLLHEYFFPCPGVLRRILAERPRFDVIHSHCPYSFLDLVLGPYARARGIPWIMSARGSLDPVAREKKSLLKRASDVLYVGPNLRHARWCVALTPYEADNYRRLGVPTERIAVVPNGIEAPTLDTAAGRAFRRRHGIGDDEVVFLFLSRIDWKKGLDLLVPAFARARAGCPRARLVIAGGDYGFGGELDRLLGDARLGDAVVRTGMLEGADKWAALAAADAFCLTAHSEGLPMSVLEGLACGLPQVLTDACNVPEVAEAGAGVVLPREVGPISVALRRLCEDPALRREQGQAAGRLARARFDIERTVDALEGLYRGCVGAD